jgi:hypothetical protein
MMKMLSCQSHNRIDGAQGLSNSSMARVFILVTFLGGPCLALVASVRAGGGPENLLLVVNPESPASMTIANHYAALRHVPTSNILYLPWDPKAETTDIDTFRKKILAPVMDAVARCGSPIDYVIYSSDFPWGIQLDADVKRFEALADKILEAEKKKGKPDPENQKRYTVPGHFKPVGSITGLTYLCEAVLKTQNPAMYGDLRSNWYFRREVPEQKGLPSLGFRSSYTFGPQGELIKSPVGRRYMLSTMLAVTSGRGNSLDEVLNYLRRSATADGTRPKGTVYFVGNSDVRSRVRQGEFPTAVRELKALGVAAEIVEGVMPIARNDVQGAMLGTASFDWKFSKSTILPGAICEHFTSFGGIMSAGAGQTPLSEFLRYGAAGASGTVVEPFAIPNKFPAATLQVHYARGCTLAEAFYQSVFGPYQLLIVGDPLCKPWANVPRVTISGVESGAAVQGKVRLQASAAFPNKATAGHFQWFVDGSLVLACSPGDPLNLDSTKLADGSHELRVVAIESGPVATQGSATLPFVTGNRGGKLDVAFAPQTTLGPNQKLVITASAPGSIGIGVAQGSRWLAKGRGTEGRFEIPASQLGAGPVRLQVIGARDEKSGGNVLGKPIEVIVEGK